jgi:hypothetical protein
VDGDGYRFKEPVNLWNVSVFSFFPRSDLLCANGATLFVDVVLLQIGFANLGDRSLTSSHPVDFNKRREDVLLRLLANKRELDRLPKPIE